MRKLGVYDQIVINNLYTRIDKHQTIFLMNFHLEDGLRMKFIV